MLRTTLKNSIWPLMFALAFFVPTGLTGAVIVDPAGDFIDVYTGPENADLDVLFAEVVLNPAAGTLTFLSTSAGDIGITDTAIFVWGINRGLGNMSFAGIGLPDIKFDAVVVITAAGGGSVTTLDGPIPPSPDDQPAVR